MAYTTIDDPSAHFQTALYSSDSSSVTVTNDGNSDLQPDWLWIKVRNGSNNHNTFDTSRGVANRLKPNTTDAEDGSSGVSVSSDGFATGTSLGDINNTSGSNNYVAWQWKANGGTTTTNDASSTGVGTIDSVYQANTTAGFSIVTYTGTGSAGTIAHGLGVAPTAIIGKDRDDTSQWFVQHPALGATHYGELDDTTAFADDATYFNDSTPTSTVFGIGNDGATGGTTDYVAYCFAPIQGYSKFGSYKGNGTSSSADFDGPFIYTGFKPAWIMTKRSSSTGGSWAIVDNKRDTMNPTQIALFANTNGADDTDKKVDFLSNGFKLRNSRDDFNTDGVTYVYFAFAEHPFVSSKGVPVTAK